jgi:rhodanese-related sulfurtransferase
MEDFPMNYAYFLKGLKGALFLTALLIVSSSYAIVEKLTSYYNGNQRVILAFDLHQDFDGSHLRKKQTQDMLTAAKAYNASVLVEDPEDCGPYANAKTVSIIKRQLPLASRIDWGDSSTGMAKFHKLCTSNKVTSCSIDFRYSYLNPWCFQSQLKQYNSIKRDTHHAINLIQQFNDSSVLNNFYKEALKKAQKHIALVERVLNLNINAREDIPYAELFSGLLDCLILHTIHQQKNKKIIFVWAGGAHCSEVEKELTLMGYKQEYQEGIYDSYTVDLLGEQKIDYWAGTVTISDHDMNALNAANDNFLAHIRRNPLDIKKFFTNLSLRTHDGKKKILPKQAQTKKAVIAKKAAQKRKAVIKSIPKQTHKQALQKTKHRTKIAAAIHHKKAKIRTPISKKAVATKRATAHKKMSAKKSPLRKSPAPQVRSKYKIRSKPKAYNVRKK